MLLWRPWRRRPSTLKLGTQSWQSIRRRRHRCPTHQGPEEVDGLGKLHRRREENVPGEELLFRQRMASGAGGGVGRSSRQ